VVAIGEVLWDLLPDGRQLGGAPANCAVHAAALGASASLVSRVGHDEPGDAILAELRARGVLVDAVSVDDARPTGRVDVQVSENGEPRFTIAEQVAWDFIPADQRVLETAAHADALCYGTLAQRSPRSRDTIRQCLRAARRDCLRVFDANFRNPFVDFECLVETLALSDVLKLNEAELGRVAGALQIAGDETTILARLVSRNALRLVALTKGSHGSRLFGPRGDSVHPGYQVTVVDTVGAGDSFTAALIMGLLAGHPLERVNDDANRLASRVCSASGACPPGARLRARARRENGES
jgi:fructokinase